MASVVIVERAYIGAGRNQNKTYVNVLKEARAIVGTDLAEWVAANPTHPWNDTGFTEFVIEITQVEFDAFKDGSNPLLNGGLPNQPRWQQQNPDTGAVKSFGSWTDPESAASAWNAGVPLADDRFILRMFDGPVITGTHVATLDLDEGSFAGRKVVNLQLYTSADTPHPTNAQNQQTEIGGTLMIFDFTAGATDFGIPTTVPGNYHFPSNHQYKVIGPAGENGFIGRVFGRDLPREE